MPVSQRSRLSPGVGESLLGHLRPHDLAFRANDGNIGDAHEIEHVLNVTRRGMVWRPHRTTGGIDAARGHYDHEPFVGRDEANGLAALVKFKGPATAHNVV